MKKIFVPLLMTSLSFNGTATAVEVQTVPSTDEAPLTNAQANVPSIPSKERPVETKPVASEASSTPFMEAALEAAQAIRADSIANKSDQTAAVATETPSEATVDAAQASMTDQAATAATETPSEAVVDAAKAATSDQTAAAAGEVPSATSSKKVQLSKEMAAEATQPDHSADQQQAIPSMVGKASSQSAQAARNRTWQNIAIAAGAVAIAVTALILVHNNNGHRSR